MIYNEIGISIYKTGQMQISGVSTSLSEVRDSLTSPFIVKKVTINAHTPYDTADTEQTGDEVYSRSFFNARNFARLRLGVSGGTGTIGFASKSFVENAISGGYSPEEAVQMLKATKSYGLNRLNNESGLSLLSRNTYEV